MVPIATISLLAGMVLGQRFRVLILLPLFLLTLLIAVAASWAHPQGHWTAVECGVAVIVCLQIGYLGGVGIRHFTLLVRATRMSRGHVSGALPERPYAP